MKPKLWTPTFVLLILITLLSYLISQGMNSGMSVFLATIGLGSGFAGMLALIFSFTAGAVRLVVGPMVDRGHVAVTMRVGAIVFVVGTFLPALDQSVVVLILARVLQGVGFAVGTTSASAAAAQVLPQERLGEGIGYHGLGQAVANSIGPALALWLVGTDPATNLYLGMGAVALIGVVLTLFVHYEKHPEKLPESCAYRILLAQRELAAKLAGRDGEAAAGEGAAAAESVAGEAAAAAGAAAEGAAAGEPSRKRFSISEAFEKKALVGAIPQLCIAPAYCYGIYFLGLYGMNIGVENAGPFFTISAITMVLVRMNSGRFMDTVSPIKILTVAIACGILCYGLIIVAGNVDIPMVVLFAAGVPHGFMCGLASPANQSVAIKNSPKERYGAATSLFLLSLDIGCGLGAVIFGVLNDLFGFQLTIGLVIVSLVICYISAWVCYPSRDKQWRA